MSNHFEEEKHIDLDKLNLKLYTRILRRFKYKTYGYNKFIYYKGIVTKIDDKSYTVYFYHDKDERTYKYIRDTQKIKELKQKIIILSNNKYDNIIIDFIRIRLPIKTCIQYTVENNSNLLYLGIIINYEIINNRLIYVVRDMNNDSIYKLNLCKTNLLYYIPGVYNILCYVVRLEKIYEEDHIFEKDGYFEEQRNEYENYRYIDLESDLQEETPRNNQLDR